VTDYYIWIRVLKAATGEKRECVDPLGTLTGAFEVESQIMGLEPQWGFR
jgi:hypothetical protein